MARRWLMLGAALSLLLVILGAFGAHGLRGLPSVQAEPKILEWWETAIRYGSWHALGMIAVAILALLPAPPTGRALSSAGWAFLAGELLFTGSLLLMAAIEASGGRARWLGAITPFGGLSYMAGWVALLIHGARLGRAPEQALAAPREEARAGIAP